MSARQDMHEREVREVMTAGVVTIVEDASVHQAPPRDAGSSRARGTCPGRVQGRPLGWITARGLLSWVDQDETMGYARDAVTEPPNSIKPSSSVREAVSALLQPGVTHLLVQRHPDHLPEGVLSELDLLALGRD